MKSFWSLAVLVCMPWLLTETAFADKSAQTQLVSKQSTKLLPETVTFNAHIRPIMSNTCFACHGPDDESHESDFRIDSFELATSPLPSDDSMRGIVPGDPDASEVYLRIMGESDGESMPPEDFRHHLTSYDKALFRKWIQQGAQYEQHWSYAAIGNPEVPQLSKYADQVINEIDAFVLAKLEREGISPAPVADANKLVRRLYLDLVGLPPTPNQVVRHTNDHESDSYDRLVDQLLGSQHFGERMAASWLDLVRYADTVGFHGDQNLRNYPYRDYVIDAFNQNKPFDEFTRQQIAGDLKANPSTEDLIATGVLRLNMVTREGGAQPGEYLAKYKADRVRMLGTAWLGSTLACCECHNHKFDPFSIKDFYSLGAFFDDVRQWGVYSDYGYTPNKDLKGFNNEFPFPPEIRIRSESALQAMHDLKAERDAILYTALGDTALQTDAFKSWTQSTSEFVRRHPNGWMRLPIDKPSASGKTTAEVLEDASVRLSGPVIDPNEKITLRATINEPINVNALRLEMLPDELHNGHVGRSDNGRFTAEVSVQVIDSETAKSNKPVPCTPRYIRIELPGNNRTLSISEFQVFGKKAGYDAEKDQPLINVAVAGKATQSSQHRDLNAGLAIDDETETDAVKVRSLSHTLAEKDPWWELDLAHPHVIDHIVIFNRTDGNYAKRLEGYNLVLLDADRKELYRSTPKFPSPTTRIEVPSTVTPAKTKNTKLSYVQVDRQNPPKYTSGDEPLRFTGPWRSGPGPWQLPANESTLPHTGIFHFAAPTPMKPGDEIVVTIKSGDIGRVRASVTPFADPNLAGQDTETNAFDGGLPDILNQPLGDLPQQAKHQIVSTFYRSTTPSDSQLARCKQQRDAILKLDGGFAMSVCVQSISEDQLPISRVLPRGNWQDESGDLAPPSTPHFLPKSIDQENQRLTRMDLADWLTSKDNPLVARHFVNRMWKHFFGAGLSGKLDDLGSQGEWPSHPLLLDHLANEFIASGWDVKALVRKMITSRTYRQASAQRSGITEIDPENRLLAQASPRRLEAEIIRDNALFIAGLLNDRYVGGPSVYPYQPTGYYSNLQFPSRKYVSTSDRRQYRRGVYMHWQRTFLHPMLVNFDAPSRDECAADRLPSNSPQQALTLLNDPTFSEAAHAMAARVLTPHVDHAEQFEKILDLAMLRALSRRAKPAERIALKNLLDRQVEYFQDNLTEAQKVISVGNTTSHVEGIDTATLAAWTQVCRVILNLHETITRY